MTLGPSAPSDASSQVITASERTRPLPPLDAPAARRNKRRRWPLALLLLAFLAAASAGVWRSSYFHAPTATDLTAAVMRGEFKVIITERGDLESAHTYDCRCEVEGREIKIIEILPEGTHVKKGQVVVRFDTEQLARAHADQEVKLRQAEGKARAAKEELEVTKNKAEGDIAKAQLELDLAILDRDMYINGEFQVEVKDRKQSIALARRELEEAQLKLDHFRAFVKKGFGTPEQLRQREAELEQRRYALSRDEDKLMVLEKFTYARRTKELKAKAEDAERNLERQRATSRANIAKAQSDLEAAEVTVRLEAATLDRLKKQLDNCVIQAPQDGILVYSKERFWDPAGRIQSGALVYYRQHIFSLPDLTKMRVRVRIHETLIKKIRVGNNVDITIDAFPTRRLTGKVQSVATLADSSYGWDERNVKEYVTLVTIDNLPADMELKPGMTAEVKIDSRTYPDVLYLPLQAVAQRGEKAYVFRRTTGTPEQREVTVGDANDRYVIISEGVTEGDVVLLNARQLLAQRAPHGTSPAEPTAPTLPTRPPVNIGDK